MLWTRGRTAPDLTPVLSAAAPVDGGALLVTSNERSLTRAMRSQLEVPDRRSQAASEVSIPRFFSLEGAPVVVPEGWRRRPPGRSGPFPAQAT